VNITDITMRWATRSVRPAAVAGLVLASLGASACGSAAAREGQAASYLVIQALEGANCSDEEFSPFLRSDVITNGGVCEDNGRVSMRAAMRDITNPNDPSSNNRITVTRFRVTYRRSDGRNVPGVDVPYAFDGGVTFSVSPGTQEVDVPFSLVRGQAKLEAPLMQLRGLGGGVVISTIADVTFYGHDQTGRETNVTGQISVNFADWADPDN
jgi:hypothetical protein